jgi:ketosteroid isomerase-like protein
MSESVASDDYVGKRSRLPALLLPRAKAEARNPLTAGAGTAILGAAMGRRLEEHLWVRAPTLYRRLAKLVGALPPGSLVRRRALKRMVARGWAALSRGDDEIVLLFFDRDFEFNIIGWAPIAGLAERYHGHEGWLGFIALWRAEWMDSQITHTPEAMIDLGDRLVVRVTLTARGAASGADVAQTMGIVAWLADGVVVRQDNDWEWSACLEALRLDDVAPTVSP